MVDIRQCTGCLRAQFRVLSPSFAALLHRSTFRGARAVRNHDFGGFGAFWSCFGDFGEKSRRATNLLHSIVHQCKSALKLSERDPKGIRRAIDTHIICITGGPRDAHLSRGWGGGARLPHRHKEQTRKGIPYFVNVTCDVGNNRSKGIPYDAERTLASLNSTT